MKIEGIITLLNLITFFSFLIMTSLCPLNRSWNWVFWLCEMFITFPKFLQNGRIKMEIIILPMLFFHNSFLLHFFIASFIQQFTLFLFTNYFISILSLFPPTHIPFIYNKQFILLQIFFRTRAINAYIYMSIWFVSNKLLDFL